MTEEQATILIEQHDELIRQNDLLIQLGSNSVFVLVAVSLGISFLIGIQTWRLINHARTQRDFI